MKTIAGSDTEFEIVEFNIDMFRNMTNAEENRAASDRAGTRSVGMAMAQNAPAMAAGGTAGFEYAKQAVGRDKPKPSAGGTAGSGDAELAVGRDKPRRLARSTVGAEHAPGTEGRPVYRNAGEDSEPMTEERRLAHLSRKYENAHRMSLELSTDLFNAIGKAKSNAKREYEDACRRVEEATSAVEEATGKLKIIEDRYETAKKREEQVKQRLRELPYVSEAAIEGVRRKIETDKNELTEIIGSIPLAEKAEFGARDEAMSALHMTLEPESDLREKKKRLDFAEKRRDLTDYLLTVAKKSRETMGGEDTYDAARREAAARNRDYSKAYREYARVAELLSDIQTYAKEKKKAYEELHAETRQMRTRIDTLEELIRTGERRAAAMVRTSEVYDKAYTQYQEKKKVRVARGRQLEAARKEYARLLDILAYGRTEADQAADKLYRAEKLSVRSVIETKIMDKDFSYLNQYGALLQKAQENEQEALGELRRAQRKKS